MSDAAGLMDRIYGSQRHIYDATRKFYLLGRDDLIADLAPPAGARILEIGCGTARNLVGVARRYPEVACYGIDVSQAMLATARRTLARTGLAQRVRLAQADATNFDPEALFGVAAFDRVFISYALSMIPAWREVLRASGRLVAPGGSVHVVDFGDQAGLPPLFKRALVAWLARFHVTPRTTLFDDVDLVAREAGLQVAARSRYRGYAFCASLVRS